MDLTQRHKLLDNDTVEFVVVSNSNLLYQFVLQEISSDMVLSAVLREWDATKLTPIDKDEEFDITTEEREEINEQIQGLIGDVSDKYGIEITSKPENINSSLRCSISFYAEKPDQKLYAATQAVK